LREPVAAVSCGLVGGAVVLDLDYAEDSGAEADGNFVLTASGGVVEIQVTAEQTPIAAEELAAMQALAAGGIASLVALQRQTLGLS
jgi:ribonuclease PH